MSVAPHVEPARRRVRDTARSAVRSTPAADGHVHCILFDGNGDGATSPGADGHVHDVVGLEVLPAKGHAHEISSQRCDRKHNRRGNHPVPRGRDAG